MLTVIGDVHGSFKENLDRYHEIVSNCEASVQLGDFGFNFQSLDNVNPASHKILGGNHDNYDKIINYPHYLGDFGIANVGNVEFFFVRGALSIDKINRKQGVDWWKAEEMDEQTMCAALELYEQTKPDLVLSHCCPADILPFFTPDSRDFPSMTSRLLEFMFKFHRPKLWLFGHYHTTDSLIVGDTKFQCLNILETFMIPSV